MNVDERNETSDAKPVAFCQHCGKPLDQTTVRTVGRAVYCEPCLAARLSGATDGSGAANPAAGSATGPSAGTVWQWGTGMPAGWVPKSGPNPGLAALLGFIPGVGAMYNEQYAKGILHLLVFAVLISLSHSSDLFGFFAFGWICYMVIEAHHTARARRDGTPLPNPFGLNDLGERLGFGRAWPAAPAPGQSPAGDPASPPSAYPPPAAGAAVPPPGTGYVPPATAWGAPSDAYSARTAAAWGQPYSAGYAGTYGPSYVPPIPPYGASAIPGIPVPVTDIPYVPPANRFPTGAVWLIGLGTLFLLSTTGIFHVVFGWSLVGFVLVGLGIWIFLHRMMDTGAAFGNDGSAGYPLRVMRALGPSVWVFTIGVLLLLDAFHLVPWHHSWPLFIILAGVMALLQRAAYNSAAVAAYESAQYSPAVAAQGGVGGETATLTPLDGIETHEAPRNPQDTRPHQEGN